MRRKKREHYDFQCQRSLALDKGVRVKNHNFNKLKASSDVLSTEIFVWSMQVWPLMVKQVKKLMGDGTLHSMICTLKLKKIHKSTNTKIEIHCACIVQHCSIYTYTTSYTLNLDISTNAFIHLGTYAVPVCPPTIAVFASAESSFMLEVNILILWPRAAVHLSMSPGFF